MLLAATTAVFVTASTSRFFTGEHTEKQRCCTPDSIFYGNRLEGAIAHACTALHAAVEINDGCQTVLNFKDGARADLYAFSAAGALFGDDSQRSDIVKIVHQNKAPAASACIL
jgi:hypothetical protein